MKYEPFVLYDGQMGWEGSEIIVEDVLDDGHMDVHLRTQGTVRPEG